MCLPSVVLAPVGTGRSGRILRSLRLAVPRPPEAVRAEATVAGAEVRAAEHPRCRRGQLPVHEVGDLLLQVLLDRLLLRRRQLARRHGRIELLLDGRHERADETVGRLALGRGDLGERLTALQVGAKLSRRQAEVGGRGRVVGEETGPEPETAVSEPAVSETTASEPPRPNPNPPVPSSG